MLYATYMQKAKEVCIDRFVESGKWYLEPDWRIILRDNQLNNFKLQDSKIDWSIVEDVLKLEVEKRNARDNKLGYVADWLYDTLTSTVEPAMLSEETDLVKNMLELAKANRANEKQAEEGQKEKEPADTGDTDGDEFVPAF